MNSKLLEEAIIDAEALKEAALKNAEQAILEKYAPEVRSAIQNLLEQEDMSGGSMPPLGGEISSQAKEMDVPMAATDGEKLCPCPDEDEVVTISLADLEDAIKKTVSDTARASSGPSEEAMGMEQAPELDMEPELPAPEEEEEELPEEPIMEEIELDEELILSLLSEEEEEKPDYLDLDKDGDKEEPMKKAAKDKEQEPVKESKVLPTDNSKLVTENKKVLNENKLLVEKLEKLLEKNSSLLQENKKIKETALEISKRLEETNLVNAKLFYKNRALCSDSLNERQKNKIVEAVSEAGSIEEVKMIYETLCNAVGTFDSKGPKSLSEAVEQKGGFIIKPRQNKTSDSSPLHTRWQKIAGIKK